MKRDREDFEDENFEFKEEEKEKSIYPDGGGWWRGKLLGSGAHGRVHLAHFPKPSIVSPRFEGFPSKVAVKSAFFPSDSKELETEKAFYEKLAPKQSPFLLRYFGEDVTITKDGRRLLNLFIEYASGGSLHDVISVAEGMGFLESRVKGFARAILLGICHIHEEGYIHRDLKPGNVLLVEQGNGYLAKIGDFGLVKSVDDETDVVIDTGNYLAPESLNEGIQDQPSDIWALGCLVYAMLNGTTEWIGEMIIDDSDEKYSREAADFMNYCSTRADLDRPAAEMLLDHPFIKTLGPGEGEDGEEYQQSETEEKSTNFEESSETEKSENETMNLYRPPTIFGGDEDENMSFADSSESRPRKGGDGAEMGKVFRGEEDGYDGDRGSDSSQNMP